ncbi:hypothetical protein diail_1916 [Diaporthe ilicicola]|nr:hypothetical protein diail_1916 [Diaporthe ilicicola]
MPDGVQVNKNTVKLVERSRSDPRDGLDIFGKAVGPNLQLHNLYVSLSHCWGKSQHYTLNSDTAADLKEGIDIAKLPKTFRDAINFASQVHNVGWIWIDSLCIYQGGPDSEEDWLEEAALMQRVYQESYLNISATAASNSDMGLYSERDCRTLWENEVSLKVDGIPGLMLDEDEVCHNSDMDEVNRVEPPENSSSSADSPMLSRVSRPEANEDTESKSAGTKPMTLAFPEPLELRRCFLIDTSHWDDLVNTAPVNTRAWVLQERLLAPRVLHFCKGSIAWECGGFTRAEGQPTGLPKLQLRHDKILPEVSLKGLEPFEHGKILRSIRLGSATEPDTHIPERDLYGFELWARVVEVYSRLNLTVAKDKLIALSGIAQLMSTKVLGSREDPARYVAGLWYRYLESQLLWRVEPTFRRQDQTFYQPARRPTDFRVPSFSWASVDAQIGVDGQPGNGIIYGEVTDQDLLIDLGTGQDNVVIKTKTDNAFGVVDGGHIMIYGILKKITLFKGKRGSFYWRLLEDDGALSTIDKREHRNVYLDAPDDDQRLHGIFESDNVYCLPAARGPRSVKDASKYIICLILQRCVEGDEVDDLDGTVQKDVFHRIGLTKLSCRSDKRAYEHILTHHATETQLPCSSFGFDTTTKRHLIRII